MTMQLGTNTGLYVATAAPATDPKPVINQWGQLSATVDAKALLLNFDAPRAGGCIRMRYDGVDLLNVAADHGRGIQFAHNALPTGEVVSTNVYSPTEQGSQVDGASAALGSSNLLYIAFSADGKRCVRKNRPAFWMQPNQVTVPSHPALNRRILSRFDCTVDITIGYAGNDHIIQWLTDVTVPTDAQVQGYQILDCVQNSIIAEGTLFDTVEYLTPSTGATRAYPGFPDTSNTEVCLISNAAGTIAMAPYQPLGEWGATGYAQCYSPAGVANTFIRAREVVASIEPGLRMYNAYTCFGTRAQVIAAVQQLDAANITRSVPIALPDVA